MEDKIIFKLNNNQNVGKEFAEIFNGNYVVDTIEIILNSVVNKFKNISFIEFNNITLLLFLNYFYNNKIICNVCPIYYKTIEYRSNIHYDEYMNIDDCQENYELIITFKYISNIYYFSFFPIKKLCSNYNIIYQTSKNNIYSTNFDDLKYIIYYLLEDYEKTMELWIKYLETKNNILIYEKKHQEDTIF